MSKVDQKFGQFAVEAAKVAATVGTPLGPFGPVTVDLVLRLGEEILCASSDRDEQLDASLLSRLGKDVIVGASAPAIIGLGRCGCRVTASLARMINASIDVNGKSKSNFQNEAPKWLSRFFHTEQEKQAYRLDPILVVGDLNENTFTEIKGLISESGNRAIADQLLILDYSPIAKDGAGNIPIFGEFFTRALIGVSPRWNAVNPDWNIARTYLLDNFERQANAPKLAFYVFGAAGGSGAGGAMELHRAQRTVLALSKVQVPRIYFSAIAVIPEDISINDHQQRNTGRMILQYLADIDIRLESEADYARELQPRYATQLRLKPSTPHGDDGDATVHSLPIPPWDSLGIVSNQIMTAIGHGSDKQSSVEDRANAYIAQQVFNLAYSQSAAEALKQTSTDNVDPTTKFQSIKLDVEDLINGLCGPYAIGFSAAEPGDVGDDAGVDRFFMRAIDVPALYPSKSLADLNNTIQGISVCPQNRDKYASVLNKIKSKADSKKDEPQPLIEVDLSELAKMLFFLRCPRVVIVLTSPVEHQVTSAMRARIESLVNWLFPNVRQARIATIAGTTPFYSLSLFMEGSALNTADVRDSIVSYLFSCWQHRSPDESKAQAFTEQYKRIVDQAEPITETQIEDWLGKTELYGDNVAAWAKRIADHEGAWGKFVGSLKSVSDAEKAKLSRHTVASCMLTPKHIASALRFVNYMRKNGKPAKPKTDDE